MAGLALALAADDEEGERVEKRVTVDWAVSMPVRPVRCFCPVSHSELNQGNLGNVGSRPRFGEMKKSSSRVLFD